MTHEHHWEASDIPGVCLCKCGGERYFNRFTQSYEIEEGK
jgi:hypothetical protein